MVLEEKRTPEETIEALEALYECIPTLIYLIKISARVRDVD